jgi:hypothetical protein
LSRIGVLELIDQQMAIALGHRFPHLFIACQQASRRIEKIVEIQQSGGAVVFTKHILSGLSVRPKVKFDAEWTPHLMDNRRGRSTA